MATRRTHPGSRTLVRAAFVAGRPAPADFSIPILAECLEPRRLFAATLADVIGDDLSAVYAARAEFTSTAPTGSTSIPGAKLSNRSLMRFEGSRVQVQVTSKGNSTALVKELGKVGGRVISKFGRVVDVSLPIAALANLPSLTNLKSARPYYKPSLNAGKVEDQAVQALKADIAAKQYGVDGTGITVGIISDSYNRLGGASADVSSGDLPSGVNVVKELPVSAGSGSDEGRAMAQLVHDVAPGASIAFYTAFVSEADFANGIIQLAKPVAQGGAGCQVIVDDVGYFDEPVYQDGIVGQAVNTAVNTYGVSYFSAAGNSGRSAYESAFRSTTATVTSVGTATFHNFSTTGTDVYMPISVGAGAMVTVSFQWDQPYGSASTVGNNCQNNLDVYLLNSTKSSQLDSSTINNVGNDPVEVLQYTNSSGSTVTSYLVAKLTSGAAPGAMKAIVEGATITSYSTNSGTSFGHPMATNGAGVGAARYTNTPAFGAAAPTLESFSSAGGTPFLFSSAGVRLASADLRQQPRFTSINGTNTTFFGQTFEGNGLLSFFGTSAAAPHAAAVAALLKQAVPSLTASQIYTTLQNTAIDMSTAGFDFDTGYGLVQADAALAAVAASSLSGTVYRDYNNNAAKDTGEPGLPTAVFLDSNTNGVVDSGSSGTLSSTNTPLAITDGTTGTPSRVTSNLTVSGLAGRVTKVTVTLNVTHAKPSQLGLTLISPSGMRIPLFSTVGANQSANGTGYNITLDDSSANGFVPFTTSTTSGVSGTYKPQVKLSGLNGENPNGTWKLEARDFITNSTGTINSWSLNINYAETSTTSNSSGAYSFTGLTPSSYYGSYNVRQTVPSGLSQTVPASPYAVSVPLSSTNTANFADFAPLATIASTVVDDASGQRSAVRSYTVTFNGVIPQANILAGAFSIVQTTGSIAAVTTTVNSVTVLGGTQTAVVLTFSGSNVVGNSLADGQYILTIDGSKITDSSGAPADPAGTGNPGTTTTRTIFRLYGDATGDGLVNNSDYFQFRQTFGLSSSDANFKTSLDYDNSGLINNSDYFQFRARFGTTTP